MKNDTPIVSIIIPLYNKERYIQETLESVSAQEFPHWEVIIVDDGSTDNSLNIVKDLLLDESRFRLIERQSEVRGGSVCRNIGLKKARGKYIIFLDADDLLLPHALKQRVDKLTDNPEIDFAIYPVGHFDKKIGDTTYVKYIQPKEDHLLQFLSYQIPWHTTSPIWKRAFLMKLKGFDESFKRLQDVELHTRALLVEGRKYLVDDSLDFYHRIDDQRRDVAPLEKTQMMVESFLHYLEMSYQWIMVSSRANDNVVKDALKKALFKLASKLVNAPISIKEKITLIFIITRREFFNTVLQHQKDYIIFWWYIFYGYIHFLKKKVLFRRLGWSV